MFMLQISAADDFTFAFVIMLYGAAVLIAMCLIMAVIEWFDGRHERRERRRRNKNRRGYVYINSDRRYR